MHGWLDSTNKKGSKKGLLLCIFRSRFTRTSPRDNDVLHATSCTPTTYNILYPAHAHA